MKVGILTFHWATNYGAVLQCCALQNFLESLGNEVQVINYKPRQYDDNIYTFLRLLKFKNLTKYINEKKKEKALEIFRIKYISQTRRFYSYKDLNPFVSQFEAIISGSDQVANPSFLLSGEGEGIVSPTYFLGFPFYGLRIGYALSFGCVSYPKKACNIAANYIKKFNVVTVREKTGIDILKSMGRDDAKVVPDPTILMPSEFYQDLAYKSKKTYNSYIYSFFIRYITDRKVAINKVLNNKNILWNNDDNDYSMEGWLGNIKHAEFVITDSFHCVVMCLKFHVPFVVITEKEGNVGMNDRLYTLLGKCGLIKCILHKSLIGNIINVLTMNVKWGEVDSALSEYCNEGKSILERYLK